jgi:hypothetical protein
VLQQVCNIGNGVRVFMAALVDGGSISLLDLRYGEMCCEWPIQTSNRRVGGLGDPARSLATRR